MEIIKYNESYKELWNGKLLTSKNGIFLFDRNYMDYHKYKFTDHSLIVLKNKKIVALFPANEVDKIIYSHGGLTFGSLVIDNDTKTVEVLHIFDSIKKYYKELGFEQIIYKVIPYIFHKYPANEDLYALFKLNAQLVRRDISSVINLKNKIKFSETKKQAVKKCQKNELEIYENNDFKEFWVLLTEVLEKFGTLPTHNINEIELLKDSFSDRIKLFEARKKGELIAGIVIYEFENVIHTQYMANSNEGRKIGALDFINDKLINEIYSNMNYFSFGISTENNGQDLNTGLIQQKEMMGGRGVTHDFYSITL